MASFEQALRIVLALYGLSAICGLVGLRSQKPGWERAVTVFLALGALVQAGWLIFLSKKLGAQALAPLTWKAVLSELSLAAACVALYATWRWSLERIGGIAAATSFLFTGVVYYKLRKVGFDWRVPAPLPFASWLVWVHAALMVFAQAFVGLAAWTAVLWKLRSNGEKFAHWPKVEVWDGWTIQASITAFFLQSLGLMAGSAASFLSRGQLWVWEPKETLSLALWLVIALSLHLRVLGVGGARHMAGLAWLAAMISLLALSLDRITRGWAFLWPHTFIQGL